MSILNTVYFYDEWITVSIKQIRKDSFYPEDSERCFIMNMTNASQSFRRGEGTCSSLGLKIVEAWYLSYQTVLV